MSNKYYKGESMEIHRIFEALKSHSGKIEKREIIEQNKDNEVFKEILRLTYSPNIVFYMKQIPKKQGEIKNEVLLEEAVEKLFPIYSRKVTGNNAKEFIQYMLNQMSEENAEIIRGIINKGFSIGINKKIINEAIPGLIPEFPYMGAKPFSYKNVKKMFENNGTVICQIKMDGRYVNIFNNDGEGIMVSRNGKNSFVPSEDLLNDISNIDDYVLNGEFLVEGFSRYEANGIIASIIKIYEKEIEGKDVSKDKKKIEKHGFTFDELVNKVYITVWDLIPRELFIKNEEWKIPYSERLEILKDIIENSKKIKLIHSKYISNYDECLEYFQEVLKQGEEGLILKSADNTWKDGKSKQVKMKLEMTVDLRIIDYVKGKGKFENTLGAIVCASENEKLFIQASGFTDDLRNEIWENRFKYLYTIVEIKANAISKDENGKMSLLHPVFKSLRNDKDNADTLNEIINIQNMILGIS
jgi:ATP-dependent DNA ligase